MIHSPQERAQYAEHSFDLRRLPELEPLVDIPLMIDRPPVLDGAIDPGAIGAELRSWFHMSLKEPDRVMALHRTSEQHERDLPRALLLAHDERPSLEIRLVELHDFPKDHVVFGEVLPEKIMPAGNRLAREPRELRGLRDGDARRPRPEDHPEFFIREFHPLEPGMRDEREFEAAGPAAVAPLKHSDLSRPAFRAEHVFPEDHAADEFLDLPLRRNLVEVVHAFHDSAAVPSGLHYP